MHAQSKFKTVDEITDARLCSGCGACAYAVPDKIRMVDRPADGLRPQIMDEGITDEEHRKAVAVCPGIHLEHDFDEDDPDLIRELTAGWGPVYELWEGYATDPELRYAGSSGGAASALAAYAIERAGFEGVVHTGARKDAPHLNETVTSRTRADLLSRTGSRYAPASPCDGLGAIEYASGPFAFIGKPCDVAAARKAAAVNPRLADNLRLTIAFFCAGTPSTAGTLEMLNAMGISDPTKLTSLRYRGNGWPGPAEATVSGGLDDSLSRSLSYEQAWGEILTKHVQWRCRLCVDHTGEFADIAVGDPWYREIQPEEHGSSLILTRTPRGRDYLLDCIAAGYLRGARVEAALLPQSQPNLLRTRGAVWGRMFGCRLLGAKVPTYSAMRIWRFWLRELSFLQRLKSVFGTISRVRRMQRTHTVRSNGSPSYPAVGHDAANGRTTDQ
jgi:coenzyme F420 hydrogenase subunit beta